MRTYFYLLSMLISISQVFGSYSIETSKGQNPVFGSFYMVSDRTKFLNPAYTEESQDSLGLESEGEASYKNDDYAVSVGRLVAKTPVLDFLYQVNELSGLSAFISPLNGQGLDLWGFNFGFKTDEMAMYLGGTKEPGEDFAPKIGMKFVDVYEGTLFLNYKGQFFSVEKYAFLVGWGKEYKQFFGDITYSQNWKKAKNLTLTVGGKFPIFKELYGIGSGQKELFFNQGMTTINVGLEYKPTAKLEFDLSHSLTAFAKTKPTYSDINLMLSAKYLF